MVGATEFGHVNAKSNASNLHRQHTGSKGCQGVLHGNAAVDVAAASPPSPKTCAIKVCEAVVKTPASRVQSPEPVTTCARGRIKERRPNLLGCAARCGAVGAWFLLETSTSLVSCQWLQEHASADSLWLQGLSP
jgi:hypothetical protein